MIGPLLGPDLQELIREKRWDALRDALSDFDPSDIAEILTAVPDADDVAIFRLLPRDLAGRVFSYLPLDHQENLVRSLTNDQMRTVLQGMTPDDQARLLEELPAQVVRRLELLGRLKNEQPRERISARNRTGIMTGHYAHGFSRSFLGRAGATCSVVATIPMSCPRRTACLGSCAVHVVAFARAHSSRSLKHWKIGVSPAPGSASATMASTPPSRMSLRNRCK